MSKKFTFAHFPVGTQFKIDGLDKDGTVYTVLSLCSGGPGHWLIHKWCEQPTELLLRYPYVDLTHVTEIVKRGIGPVVTLSQDVSFPNNGLRGPKTRYKLFRYQKQLLIENLLAKHAQVKEGTGYAARNCIYDVDKLVAMVRAARLFREDMSAQTEGASFGQAVVRAQSAFSVCSINKKQLNRFIQQNMNRVLVSVKQASEDYYTNVEDHRQIDSEALEYFATYKPGVTDTPPQKELSDGN